MAYLLCILLSDMPKRFFKRKCFLMLAQETSAKQRKLTILGQFEPSICIRFVIASMFYAWLKILLLLLPDILFIGFFFVHLAEELKTIGIIMAIRGWILLDLY